MAWLYLLIAGLLEVAWAIGLKYTDGFTRLVPSLWTVGKHDRRASCSSAWR